MVMGVPDESKSHAKRKGASKGPDSLRTASNTFEFFERDGKTIPICPMKGTLENKKILDFGNITRDDLYRLIFDIVTAKDDVDAMEQLESVKPDLMLLDIEMPRMDGFEVTNLVRHHEIHQNLPIIMITSRTGEKHRERAFSLGVTHYMGKPFQEAELLANIQQLLAEKQG